MKSMGFQRDVFQRPVGVLAVIDANSITNPLPLQFNGTAQAPANGSGGGAAQSPHAVLRHRGAGNPAGSFVDQGCGGQQCLQHKYSLGFLVSVALPAVFFILTSVFLPFSSSPCMAVSFWIHLSCRISAVNNGCRVFQVLKGHKHRRKGWNSWVKRLVKDAICVLYPIRGHVKRHQILL